MHSAPVKPQMTRTELTQILLLFMQDSQIKDPKAFLESLDDAALDKFALGYLHGISHRLRHYEELLGVKFSK
jgi:hypothetical protein